MTVDAKICGIKTREALDTALDEGARYVGLVFYPKSPRNISIVEARDLSTAAAGVANVVALVVDADDRALTEIVDTVAPDYLQLHGAESVARVAEIKSRFGVPVIKAVPVATAADVAAAERYRGVADMILFDAKPPEDAILPGGNGLAFDWRALDGAKGAHDFMLSGGLNAENVAEAIRLTGAAAVDVSSGVERAPGVKDPELIRRFLRAVNTAKQG